VTATTSAPAGKRRLKVPPRARAQVEGIQLLIGIVGLMWVAEAINWADSYQLRGDGIYSRSISHLWGIFTAPFIHENFAPHLLDNTIPLLFMGLIIAFRGALRLAQVTAVVIVLGGLGTWLIGPANVSTIGASGVVFGYATYLFARGFFNRSLLELLTGAVVGLVWGGALLSSIVPHAGISWQGHLSGAIAGVVAAYVTRRDRPRNGHAGGQSSPAPAK
jgi:membrane associated rhomboid family serine protease